VTFGRLSPIGAIAVRFNPDAIAHGIFQTLSAPEVLFRRLHAHMSEQELDLLKLSASEVTKSGTCSPKVVGRQVD